MEQQKYFLFGVWARRDKDNILKQAEDWKQILGGKGVMEQGLPR